MKENKIIDSQGRLFGKISIIDVLVICAVAVVCMAVHMKNNVLVTTGGGVQTVPMEITLVAEMVPYFVAEAIEIGDTMYDRDHATGGAIGVITSKEILPASKMEEVNDGSFSAVTSDTDVNVLLTVEGSGSVVDGRYSFNRVYELGANAARNFETKYAWFTGVVLGVNTL